MGPVLFMQNHMLPQVSTKVVCASLTYAMICASLTVVEHEFTTARQGQKRRNDGFDFYHHHMERPIQALTKASPHWYVNYVDPLNQEKFDSIRAQCILSSNAFDFTVGIQRIMCSMLGVSFTEDVVTGFWSRAGAMVGRNSVVAKHAGHNPQ